MDFYISTRSYKNKGLFLIMILVGVSLFLNTQQLQGSNSNWIIPNIRNIAFTFSGSPVRLIIPDLNIDAAIQEVGITEEGEMDVPTNSVDTGWFKLGPKPGENGSAVIAGHFDGERIEKGVFAHLGNLRKGNLIYVKNDLEETIVFTVQEIRLYDPGYADEVFSRGDGIHLNLVTCDGVWDETTKSYSKRLVVFASRL